MRVRVHRGSHEVGGSCVEVEHGGYRLVLDVGKPLSAGWKDRVELPSVPGLANGSDPHLLGVLISHPHLDHYGLADQVAASVPLYVGRAAAAVIEAASFFNASGPVLSPAGHWEHEVPVTLSPFTVTPQLVDHSAFDSYALVIDAGGRRLMYTGDLRGHGRKGRLFEAMVAHPPSGVDVLLMEGTHVTDPAAPASGVDAVYRSAASEADLEGDLATRFRTTAGLPVVASSAQNIDRLVTVYRAARRANRTLLVDLYTATVAQSTGRSTIPQPGFPQLGVYVPNRQRVAVKTSGQFHRTEAIRSVRVFPEHIAADPSRYVVLSSGSTVTELLRQNALKPDGLVVWSLWSGYLSEAAGRRLKEALVTAGVPLVEAHTSGHATVPDLRRLVEAVDPGRVVPIHTDAPDAFAGLFARATPVADGDWWDV